MLSIDQAEAIGYIRLLHAYVCRSVISTCTRVYASGICRTEAKITQRVQDIT